jgi:hypothetical protein
LFGKEYQGGLSFFFSHVIFSFNFLIFLII